MNKTVGIESLVSLLITFGAPLVLLVLVVFCIISFRKRFRELPRLARLTFIMAALLMLFILLLVFCVIILKFNAVLGNALFPFVAITTVILSPTLLVLSTVSLIREKSLAKLQKRVIILFLILSAMICLALFPFVVIFLTPNM